MDRPDIPRPLERQVLVEAGHRCAIPTCRQTPVEIAHIVPWKETQEHTFDNLIALCPTCHARYDNGEIDRQAMLRYKANLSVLNERYSDLEKRVLAYFAERPDTSHIWLPGGLEILLDYLEKDGLIVDAHAISASVPVVGGFGFRATVRYELTEKGREFINRWLSAEELE